MKSMMASSMIEQRFLTLGAKLYRDRIISLPVDLDPKKRNKRGLLYFPFLTFNFMSCFRHMKNRIA